MCSAALQGFIKISIYNIGLYCISAAPQQQHSILRLKGTTSGTKMTTQL